MAAVGGIIALLPLLKAPVFKWLVIQCVFLMIYYVLLWVSAERLGKDCLAAVLTLPLFYLVMISAYLPELAGRGQIDRSSAQKLAVQLSGLIIQGFGMLVFLVNFLFKRSRQYWIKHSRH